METLIVNNKVLYDIFYHAGLDYMKYTSIGVISVALVIVAIYFIFRFSKLYDLSISKTNKRSIDYISIFVIIILYIGGLMGYFSCIEKMKISHSYEYLMDSYNKTKYDNVLKLKYPDFKTISSNDSTFIMQK